MRDAFALAVLWWGLYVCTLTLAPFHLLSTVCVCVYSAAEKRRLE